MDCVREALYTRNNPKVPTEFIVRLLEVVLKHNIFEFNSELFLQLIGTAMGSRPAPSYANIFMANKIDPEIIRLANESESDPIDLYKRFLDDIFMVYTGSIESLHMFLSEINNLHPSIKFTMSHTTPPNKENPSCDCKAEHSLPFLDTSCKILDGKIVTDLFRKETDRFFELKNLLLSRDYKPRLIDSAIERARNVPRSEALKRVSKEITTNRPVFVIHFDPRLPSIPAIVKKHWRTMTQDPRLQEIFPVPPLVAYKRPKNIKDKLIRSRVPQQTTSRPKRSLPGMRKCNQCSVCSFIQEGRTVKATATNYKMDINTSVDCSSKNIIYLLGCNKCPQQYIGESERMLKERFAEHKGYVNTQNISKATEAHFNSKGHSVSDMRVTVLEKVFSQDPQFRKQREKLYIQKFNTRYRGINRINGG